MGIPAINLVGQVFGRLTVLERAPKVDSSNNARWLCRCVCGNLHEVSAPWLRNGDVKSCGCLRRGPKSGARSDAALTAAEKTKRAADDLGAALGYPKRKA